MVGEVLDLLLGVRPLADVADDADDAAAVERRQRDLLRERDVVAAQPGRLPAPAPAVDHRREDEVPEALVLRVLVKIDERFADQHLRRRIAVQLRQGVVDVGELELRVEDADAVHRRGDGRGLLAQHGLGGLALGDVGGDVEVSGDGAGVVAQRGDG